MRRALLVILASLSLLLLFGCSEDPNAPVSPTEQIQLVQRPEFVDTRPEAVIQASFLSPSMQDSGDKKKPPRPDPGGDTDPNPNPANKYAYIVGISDYDGTANDLNYCDDDARDMKAYLQSQGFTCRVDIDNAATAAAIVAGLDWLVAQAAPGDEVFFSYSGHGARAGSDGSSLISRDLYYVTHGLVMEKFNAIDCTKKMAAIDACVIGDFHDDVVAGTLMATASDRTYSYDAPEFTNGAWTHFFLEAAEDMGLVFGEDISGHAKTEMKSWGRLHHLRTSAKNTDSYSGMFDI